MRLARKTRVFWPLLLVVFLSDCTTKRAVVETLESPGSSHEVLGEAVRFTLVYNDGAAMGLVGSWAKELLGLTSLFAAAVLFGWYRKAPPEAMAFGAATALLIAGALGNGWQRLFAPPPPHKAGSARLAAARSRRHRGTRADSRRRSFRQRS